jgi:YD repeat-containing protein
MKKLSLTACFLSAATVIAMFSNCSKSAGTTATTDSTKTTTTTTITTPVPTCDLTGITQGNAQTYTLGYDDQHRLTSWHGTFTIAGTNNVEQQSEAFEYGTNYVIATWVGPVTTIDSLVLNSDGSISADYFSDATTSAVTKYTYTSNGELLTSTHTQDGTTSAPKIYTWENGDLATTSYGATFNYDTTKKVVTGDENQLTQLLQFGTNAWTIRNTHVLTSEFIGFTETYSYTYDSTGKITSLTNVSPSDNTTTVQSFTYACLLP